MSRIFAITKILLFVLLAGMTSTVFAQSDDFTTWTKFKVNYKIDPRFSLLSNLEFRTKDDVSRMDRLGLAIGGEYRAYSFLKLEAGYETHFRNLGDSEWKFRHRYNFGATASFHRGDSKARLRSRLKLAYAPEKGIVSPYFSIEIYQSLDDAPFWRADRMRYRPGVEIALAKRWALDVFYCYQYESPKGKHIAGVEIGYSF